MLRLLIIEDHSAVAEVVAELVEDMYRFDEIVQVQNLADARKQLTRHHWDAVITDLSLGDGNALDLLQSLREEGAPLPPTILMSGFLTDDRRAQARRLGVRHFLEKPFTPEKLMHCLEELFGAPAGNDAAESEHKECMEAPSERLLTEVFGMDRQLGLVYRMLDELPSRQDVASVCASAVRLAMDIVHADKGFLALYERQSDRLMMVAGEGIEVLPLSRPAKLKDTPFQPLIAGEEAFLLPGPDSASGACWPGSSEPFAVACAVCLQGVPIGVLCLSGRTADLPLQPEEKQLLRLLVKKLDILLDNRAVHAALADSMRETLVAMVATLEARDRYTRDHSTRVARLAAIFARDLGLSQEQIDLVRTGGLLHDLGKCGIPDAVLLKPGRYTQREFAIMKAHPAIGAHIMKNMDTMVRERLIIRHHHERFDGLGYPDRLAGEEIPLEARIVCVADAIDAMTTHRVYRKARPLSFCQEQLERNSGTQFDPQVVEVAMAAIERGDVSTQAEPGQSDDEAIVMPVSSLISVKTEVRHDV